MERDELLMLLGRLLRKMLTEPDDIAALDSALAGVLNAVMNHERTIRQAAHRMGLSD